jgi:hypothetical protein
MHAPDPIGMMSAMDEPRVPAPPPTEGDGRGAGSGPPASSQPPSSSPAPSEPTPATGANVPVTRGRRITVRVLIWGTTLLAIIGMFAVWADRQMFSADNWANTSTRLLQNEQVRDATSNYLVEQLYANVNVEEELKKRLPKAVQPLAGPISGGIRTVASEVAKRTLATAKVQEAWKTANRAADQTLVNIVEGGKGSVAINGGVVTLDLASILTNITKRLGLPEVSSKLPPSVAHLTVLKSKQIKAVQDIGKGLKGLALLFTILVPVLYAIAIFLAKGFRRRTLMHVGIGFVVAGVVVFLLRTLVVNGVTDSLVKTEAVKPAAHAALKIGTSMLSEIAGAFVVVGVPLIAAAWFAGPAHYATRARQAIAPFLRERPEWTYGIVAAIMLLIFIWDPIPSTGKPAGVIVYLLLAFFGTFLLRRQTAEEFPSP